MINAILGLFNLQIRQKYSEPLKNKIQLPSIQFNLDNEKFTETIIEYGWNKNKRFYVITNNKNLIFIDDEETQNLIHYGDEEDLIDISDKELNFEGKEYI